jgi:hypothetical protein
MPAGAQPGIEDDPVLIVRTIGRLAQMILELRDEYVTDHRDDSLDQIERRLDEMNELHTHLRKAREQRDASPA